MPYLYQNHPVLSVYYYKEIIFDINYEIIKISARFLTLKYKIILFWRLIKIIKNFYKRKKILKYPIANGIKNQSFINNYNNNIKNIISSSIERLRTNFLKKTNGTDFFILIMFYRN